MLRKYSALALYILLLGLPAAALLLYHYVNTRYYGGALGSGMADIAGMLLIGAVAVHVPEYDRAEGRFVRRASGGRAGCSEGFTLGSAPRCLPPCSLPPRLTARHTPWTRPS